MNQVFIGILKELKGNVVLDTGKGSPLYINLNGVNPEADKNKLLPFLGRRVRVEGQLWPPSNPQCIVTTDIIVLGSTPKTKPPTI